MILRYIYCQTPYPRKRCYITNHYYGAHLIEYYYSNHNKQTFAIIHKCSSHEHLVLRYSLANISPAVTSIRYCLSEFRNLQRQVLFQHLNFRLALTSIKVRHVLKILNTQ